MESNIVILTTCAEMDEAERIGQSLVGDKLAACVQILPKLRSIYRWQGKVESTGEHLLLIKTTSARMDAVEKRIAELHSYEVPEVIAVPIVGGSEKYLAWLEAAVAGGHA